MKRSLCQSSGLGRKVAYYFVDTNIIVDYVKRKQTVKDFIHYPFHHFMYSETVRFEHDSLNIDTSDIEKHFRFFDSNVELDRKERGLRLLKELWRSEFGREERGLRSLEWPKLDKSHEKKKRTNEDFDLSKGELERFQNDLFMIFEAGVGSYKAGALPENDLREAPLITTNKRLMKKFLERGETRAVLERAINFGGMEHLLTVKSLDDAIKDWKKS